MTWISGDLPLVQLNENDISGLIRLSASVGWDYGREEVLTVLKSGTVLGHKTSDGEILSCAAIIPYDSSLAWLGMVIVDPGFRGKGLAKEAVLSCLKLAAEGTSILLVATEEGKPLYLKLGFTEAGCIQKYLCPEYKPASFLENGSASIIRKYSADLFDSLIELDKAAFGDGRTVLLKNRIAQSRECLAAFSAEGKLIGYGLAIQGTANLILGPIVAPDTETAALLLDHLAAGHDGRIRIDVPAGQTAFSTFLDGRGFKLAATPPIMIFRDGAMPVRDGRLFALAAQAFG
jgi:N-acetylglutamate synthase-like GNAT family acetyltransferase